MRKTQLLLLLLTSVTLQAQLLRPTQFSLESADSVYSGLIGSSISDIAGVGDTLWLGSGHGLSATFDRGESFVGYSSRYPDLGQGGVSALVVYGDTLWVAMGFDTTTAFGDLKAGGGISRSIDGGASWTFLGQPMDELQVAVMDGDTTYGKYSKLDLWGVTILSVDVVTPVQNITYDLAFDGERLWATSFGGGLRVSSDLGDTWEKVMLPWDKFDVLDSVMIHSLQLDTLELDTISLDEDNLPAAATYYALDPLIHLNHIAFAVKAWSDTIWVGTSGGINRSLDGGESWEHFTFQNSNISGNWVIALNRQTLDDGSERIWASTITTGAGDATGFSFYDSETGYWRAPLLGSRVWNIGSEPNAVFAATDEGLWKTRDGLNFVLLPNYHNLDYSEVIYSDAVYSVLINNDGAIWVGTGDGLAVSNNGGLSWDIHKARSTVGGDDFYAYPNPFTPRYDKLLNGQGHLIIRFVADQGDEISITVFDFAMHRVNTVMDATPTQYAGSQELTWNGRNESGYLVANGTYFIRIEVGDDMHWTKVMVIN
ncbi:hypothetical protein HQ531_04620 [bacterium]|nr:hypothetical protein [bacterium]